MDKREGERIRERIAAAERERDSRYGEIWRDCRRRYRSQAEGEREGSNIFVPQTFMQCEVIKSRLTESIFAQRPYISVLPRGREDASRAEKVSMLLDWQLNDRMELPRRMAGDVLTSLLIYGTAVVYTGWELRERRRRRMHWSERPLAAADGTELTDGAGHALTLPQQVSEQVWEVIYDDPVIVNIPLADFFVDPQATDIAGARFCGHREYLTRAQLEEHERQGRWHIDWDELERRHGERRLYDGGFMPDEAKSLYPVHHYWEDERHLVFVERDQCVCEEENPFWHGQKPYDKCCYVALPNEFYGMGVPEVLAGLQDELNTCRNQRIDYNSLSLRRMWKLRRGCGVTVRDLVWRQNGVLQVENMDDIQEIDLQPLPADAFASESGVKQDMQDATGCHDIIMGINYTQETATTTMTRDNNASLRFKAVVREIIAQLLIPIAQKCIAMDQQFLTEPRLLRLLDEGGDEVFDCTPEEIVGEYDLSYCGAAIESAANRELERQRLLQAYSLALSDPAYQRDDAARLGLFRRVLRALNIPDTEDILPCGGMTM